VTPRTIVSAILLTLIFPAQEIWQWCRNVDHNVNWWIITKYPLKLEWALRFYGLLAAFIIRSVVFRRITSKVKHLRSLSIVLVIFWVTYFITFLLFFQKKYWSLIPLTIGMVSVLAVIISERKATKQSILMLVTFPIMALWLIWKYDYVFVKWWVFGHNVEYLGWVMFFLCISIVSIIYDTMIYLSSYKIRALHVISIVILVYSIIDLVMFFLFFNRAPYAFVYGLVGVVSMIVINWKTVKRNLLHQNQN
jgi:hypothetical protein